MNEWEWITANLSAAEKTVVTQAAIREGVSVAEFLRRAALERAARDAELARAGQVALEHVVELACHYLDGQLNDVERMRRELTWVREGRP